MNIKQLRHFVSVAEAGSYAKAAKLSNVSISTLSRSITNLEEQIGMPLITRGANQGAILNRNGQIFLHRAKASLQQLEEGIKEITDAGAMTGSVRFGAYDRKMFIHMTESVLSIYPSVEIHQFVCQHTDAEDLVLRGALDFAFSCIPPQSASLMWLPIVTDQLFVGMSINNPHAIAPVIDWNRLNDFKMVINNASSDLVEIVNSYLIRQGITPNVFYEADDDYNINHLVSVSHMFSIVSSFSARAWCNSDGTRNIKLFPLEEHYEIGIITRKESFITAATKTMAEFAVQHLRDFHKRGMDELNRHIFYRR